LAVRWFFEHDVRLWRSIIIVIGVAWSSVTFVEASKIIINPDIVYTTLLYAIIGGIPVIVSTFFTVLLLRKKYSSYFKVLKESTDNLEDSEHVDQLEV
jgi:hypothetical protein